MLRGHAVDEDHGEDGENDEDLAPAPLKEGQEIIGEVLTAEDETVLGCDGRRDTDRKDRESSQDHRHACRQEDPTETHESDEAEGQGHGQQEAELVDASELPQAPPLMGVRQGQGQGLPLRKPAVKAHAPHQRGQDQAADGVDAEVGADADAHQDEQRPRQTSRREADGDGNQRHRQKAGNFPDRLQYAELTGLDPDLLDDEVVEGGHVDREPDAQEPGGQSQQFEVAAPPPHIGRDFLLIFRHGLIGRTHIRAEPGSVNLTSVIR